MPLHQNRTVRRNFSAQRQSALQGRESHLRADLFLLYDPIRSIYGFFLITLLLTGCSSILLMHSRSMHRFRTRSMRIFMLHIQRIWQRRSKRISLPTGDIPSYPPVALSFTLLFTKTSGISPLCTCQFVIPGGLILPFMILNLFCSNCFQSYTKCITIPYILDSFCFYSLWT